MPLFLSPIPSLRSCVQVYIKVISSVPPVCVPASMARKIYWICKAMEKRGKKMNSFITRKFLEGTQVKVKEEVEKRMRMGDW